MGCTCIYTETMNNGPVCFSECTPTAKKNHECCECGRIINTGEKYRVESGVWDGEPARFKTCIDCISIRDAFFCNGYIYTQILEDLDNHIQDSDGQISSEAIALLTPDARDRVLDMLDEYIQDN